MTGEQHADAVRLVEDVIDATSDRVFASGGGRLSVTTARTGLAVVEALVEAGWTPPLPGTPLGDIADT